MICSTGFTPDKDWYSAIWHILKSEAADKLAILGTVKNAGKTEVLMHIINTAASAGKIIGVTSIGRDGEEEDAVFLNPKPPIIVPPGSLILTYLNFIGTARNALRVVDTLRESHLQYGDLVIAEALERVRLQVAGPSKKSELSTGVARLAELGAELVLVDGALDRKGAVDPAVIPDLIMATGMALASSLEEVVEATAYTVELLQLPRWQQGLPAQNSYLSHGTWYEMPERSIGAEDKTIDLLPSQAEAVYLSGAVNDRLFTSLRKHKKYPLLIVESPFSIFVEPRLFRSYLRKGGAVYLRRGFNLLAVTVNPWSMNKPSDPKILAQAVKNRLPMVKVIDVVAGICL